jgi:hypothetical protein
MFWENVSMIVNIESKTMNTVCMTITINWRIKLCQKIEEVIV